MRVLSIVTAAVLTLALAAGPALAGEATGKVQKIDTDQKMLVLEDGKELWLKDGASVDTLKEGDKIKVSYEEQDGKSWATGIEKLPE
jgi:Cu/Ag efflux protein CusF